MSQLGEPSVEEILASIKKVIARDNRAGAAEQRRQREERGMPRSEEAYTLDEEDEEVLDLGTVGECVDDAADQQQPLVTNSVESSISESLAALAVMAEPPAAPQIVRSGETSLESLVREMLRPALAQWLDTNLPPLVERLVAAEIARIVARKG